MTAALDAARAELRAAPGVDLDYLAVTTPDLDELPADGDLVPGTVGRVLIAARVGTTRLIDNLPLVLAAGPDLGSTTPVTSVRGTASSEGDR